MTTTTQTLTRKEIARMGGLAVCRRYGRVHMQEIGAKGFATTVARHFAGDRRACMSWLHLRAAERGLNRLVDEVLDNILASGSQVASIELPFLMDPDDDIPF